MERAFYAPPTLHMEDGTRLVEGAQHLTLGVASAVVNVVRVVAVVCHDRARHRQAARRRVRQPVESPQHRAVS